MPILGCVHILIDSVEVLDTHTCRYMSTASQLEELCDCYISVGASSAIMGFLLLPHTTNVYTGVL